MCTVMVVDYNQMTRNWMHKSIKLSNIKHAKIILCETYAEAVNYISKSNVDIVLTRINKEDMASIELIKTMNKKLLFSIVLGYGADMDFNFLCNIINGGISQYLQDVLDKDKLNASLNVAYERYCFNQLKLRSIVEKAKSRQEKAYSDTMLKQLVSVYTRNAEIDFEKNVDECIDLLFDIMNGQQLYHSKSMILELMIIITERVNLGLIKTDYVLFNSKNCSAIMKFKTVAELKEMVAGYLKNLAKNIYLLSSAKDYKSLSIISATSFIKSNYYNDISRDDVASAVSLNPSYFSKFFKEQTGESFVSYLRRIRLEKARAILENTNVTIKVVSERVGYSDSKYFARLFCNHTGYTPCAYRKSITKLMA